MDSLKIDLNFKDIGLDGTCLIRDLWAKENMGEFTDSASLYIKNHGSRLVRISKVK